MMAAELQLQMQMSDKSFYKIRLPDLLILLTVVLQFLAAEAAFSANTCFDVFNLRPWSIERPPHLTPSQLLPEPFLNQLREKVGPVELKVERSLRPPTFDREGTLTFTDNAPTLLIRLLADDKEVISFNLWKSEAGNGLVVDRFRLQNPLSETTTTRGTQTSKGLPYDIFKYFIRSVKQVAKSGGYEFLETHGAQNFSVAMLYTRVLGMHPVTEEDAKYLRHLENAWETAHRFWPEGVRLKSFDEFDRILAREVEFVDAVAYFDYKKRIRLRKNDSRAEELMNPAGQVIAIKFPATGNIHLIDPGQRLVWRNPTKRIPLRLDL